MLQIGYTIHVNNAVDHEQKIKSVCDSAKIIIREVIVGRGGNGLYAELCARTYTTDVLINEKRETKITYSFWLVDNPDGKEIAERFRRKWEHGLITF